MGLRFALRLMDWTEISIEGPVAEGAGNFNFDGITMGAGTAWFGGISVERVPYPARSDLPPAS